VKAQVDSVDLDKGEGVACKRKKSAHMSNQRCPGSIPRYEASGSVKVETSSLNWRTTMKNLIFLIPFIIVAVVVYIAIFFILPLTNMM
jgi:hypothetical protein